MAPHVVHVHVMMIPANLILAIIISIITAININPAASPVTLGNPPKIQDQHLALSVLDHIANETLHARITVAFHCMDKLVGAMASALDSHLCILVSANEHPNSHGIIEELRVDGVTWA